MTTAALPVRSTLPQNIMTILSVSLAVSFAVSLMFYRIQMANFHKKFLESLQATVPNYDKLIYNQGNIRSFNADKLITYEDFGYDEFKKEKGKIVLNWDHIAREHNIPEQTGEVKRINLDNVVQLEAFDQDVFTVKNGRISLDIPNILAENYVLKDANKSRTIDTRLLNTNDNLKELYIDLKTGLVNHFSNLGKFTKSMLKNRTLIVDSNWRETFEPLTQMSQGQILPLAPWKIRSTAEDVGDFIGYFADLVDLEAAKSASVLTA
ncbi:MAG: hypothetical protein H6850_01490 [Alphaproteobacteria bacterium]|nr:MAG: hypothetical protein H6850_01490 [Alphaproteobacteria bacterium]